MRVQNGGIISAFEQVQKYWIVRVKDIVSGAFDQDLSVWSKQAQAIILIQSQVNTLLGLNLEFVVDFLFSDTREFDFHDVSDDVFFDNGFFILDKSFECEPFDFLLVCNWSADKNLFSMGEGSVDYSRSWGLWQEMYEIWLSWLDSCDRIGWGGDGSWLGFWGVICGSVSVVCFGFLSGQLGCFILDREIVPDKHEAVDSGWLDSGKGDFDGISHEEAHFFGGLDNKITVIGDLALSEILIKLGPVLKLFKIMRINLNINLSHNDINPQRDISLAIILPSEHLPSNTQVIVDKGIGYDLQVGVGIAIKEIPFGLRFTLNSHNVETVFCKVGVVFVHDQAVGVVGLYFEGFVGDFGLGFLQ